MNDLPASAPLAPAAADAPLPDLSSLPKPQGAAGVAFDVAVEELGALMPKSWAKSQTIVAAGLAFGGAGICAWQAFKSGDMAAFGAAVAAMMSAVGAIVGRYRAVRPIK